VNVVDLGKVASTVIGAPHHPNQGLGPANGRRNGSHPLHLNPVALQDSAAHLLHEKIEPVGIETPSRKACDPSLYSLPDGKKIALLAINDVDTKPSSQVATASVRAKLGTGIKKARSNANLVVCLVHWGIENSDRITDEQRDLARWLIDHGVDLVVGSHPHCVQSIDFYHGRPVAYSLGNLVFDGAPTISSWNRGALLEVDLNEEAKISSVSLIRLVLEDGLPRVSVARASGLR
jgi:hypothetical protein